MTTIRETLRRLFASPEPLPTGTYPFQSPPDAPLPYRLHLRLEPDGSGILIVNASTVLHLNQTAAEYAYHMVKGHTEADAAREISSRYRINRSQAQGDYQGFLDRINALVNTPDLDPEMTFGFDR